MCNNIHAKHEAIPKHGFGWKLFRKWGKEYISFCDDVKYKEKIGKIIWDTFEASKNFGKFGVGFCFFPTRKDARLGMSHWYRDGKPPDSTACIKKIEYWGGICKQKEDRFTGDNFVHNVALCTSFKIIKNSKG